MPGRNSGAGDRKPERRRCRLEVVRLRICVRRRKHVASHRGLGTLPLLSPKLLLDSVHDETTKEPTSAAPRIIKQIEAYEGHQQGRPRVCQGIVRHFKMGKVSSDCERGA